MEEQSVPSSASATASATVMQDPDTLQTTEQQGEQSLILLSS
jgi:hypothetical protein